MGRFRDAVRLSGHQRRAYGLRHTDVMGWGKLRVRVQPQEGEKAMGGGEEGLKPTKKGTSSAGCLLFFVETLHCTYHEIIKGGKYASCQAALAQG